MTTDSNALGSVDPALAMRMYERMVRIRVFEEAVQRLGAAGELPGATHLGIGQEATYVGACAAMRPGDYQTGTHRSHGHAIAIGSPLRPLMAELFGKESGLCKGKGGSFHLSDFDRGSLGETGIVASTIPLAVGAGLSAQVRGTDQICIAFLGDGAANEGIFHESVNLAGAWNLGVVFVIENNSYAVNTRASDVTAGGSFAARAAGYGMPGFEVDGQDAVAVYQTVRDCVDRASRGDGPSIVECKTYRFTEHANGLKHLPSYGWDQELEEWLARDPIDILEASLTSAATATREHFESTHSRLMAEVEDAVEFARASAYPPPSEAYTDNYAPEPANTQGKISGSKTTTAASTGGLS